MHVPNFLLLILTIALALSAGRAGAADDPNIIYILADDLGYGDLGCYGQENIQTPSLDQMAAEGMRFTQHYAGSTVCAPSRCVLMTGKHLGHALIRGNGRDPLRPQDVTVAEVLQADGYRNALVGKWGLGEEGSTGVPTKQGFDYFYGYLNQHHAHNYYPAFLMRNEQRVPLKNEVPGKGDWGTGVATKKVEYSHDLFAAEALEFVDQNKDRKFFLYLALTIPHANNQAGDKGMETPDLGRYAEKDWTASAKGKAAMISRMDGDIGKLLARLKEHGIDDNTIVFFSSDNGPHQEGGADPAFFDSNGPLQGIKRSLHDGGIRVPLIVRWPGRIEPGSTSDHVSYFGDMMATLAEVAGAQPPSDIDSISFLPTLLGQPQQQKQHDYLYWEFYEQGSKQSVRSGDWKAIREPMLVGEIELFNLADDIAEQNNLADQHPELVAQAAERMEQAHEPSKLWQLPNQVKQQLKSRD